MIIDTPILKVKKISSATGGSGKSISASTSSTKSGAAVCDKGSCEMAALTNARIMKLMDH
jgi:hypothetical protein